MDTEEAVAEQQNKTKVRKLVNSLRCNLTEDEIRQASDEMARRLADRDAAEGEFDSVKAQFKERIQRAETDVRSSARLIRDKYEMRMVECEEVMDWTDGMVYVTRKDTGEIIVNRRMYAEERQMELPLVTEDKD